MSALIGAHAQAPPPAPSSLRRGVPRALDQLIGQLLAKQPGDRPASAARVAARLRAIGDGAASAPVPPKPPPPKPRRPAGKSSTAKRPNPEERLALVMFLVLMAFVGMLFAGLAVHSTPVAFAGGGVLIIWGPAKKILKRKRLATAVFDYRRGNGLAAGR